MVAQKDGPTNSQGGQEDPRGLLREACKPKVAAYFRELWTFSDTFLKGHALAEKADAQTDFSYVSGHLGKF